jgi:hydrogenase maturation factor
MALPGLVIRVHGMNHEEVDVQFSDKVVSAKNIIKDIKIGEYVILNENLVIERLTEHEALKRLKQ